MNETLFSQIQRLFERTYAQVGINLEDCLIDQRRCRQLTRLAGASARELSELARTFLRTADDQLYVGIYYSRWLIEQLEEHDPRAGLTNRNIRSLIMFVEEINHALHAAIQFRDGERRIASEDFARDLELQARVDTYLVLLLFVAFFRKTQRVSRADRRWLRFHLFEAQNPGAFQDENLRSRYLETTELAASYTHFLDTLNGLRRVEEIRTFRALEYDAKKTAHPRPDGRGSGSPTSLAAHAFLRLTKAGIACVSPGKSCAQPANVFHAQRSSTESRPRWSPTRVDTLRMASKAPST